MDTVSSSKKANLTIYCHFSFKRPKNENYGLFAVAFYSDFEGKKLITATTRKYDLWENQQFVTAIQSYENALNVIQEMQGMMRDANINQVMLVTDNSTLAGWIMDPKKNKKYSAYMERAVKPYRVGAYKEIVIGIGLCEPREAEKSYKYCKEERVDNIYKSVKVSEDKKDTRYKIDVKGYKSALDIINEDKSIPIISGMEEVSR
jgi:hypothetical protein